MRRTLLLTLIGCLLTIPMLGCNSLGTKLEFNGGELYYTKNVNEAEARKLGEYLVNEKFFDGAKKTIQLDKSGDTYLFRAVVKGDVRLGW